jgi:hypothetical protein
MARSNDPTDVSGWVGWVYFGGLMMVLLGMLHAIAGLVALFEDEVYVSGPNNLWILDYTTWGWIHLVAGLVVLMGGFAVMSGKMWGRVLGILLGVFAAVANFAFIPVYPVWSIVMLTVSVLVVFALVAHGDEAKKMLE